MYVWYVQWYIFIYSFKEKRETYIGDKSGSEVRTEVYVVRSIIYMIEKERERRRRVGTIHILCMYVMPCHALKAPLSKHTSKKKKLKKRKKILL